MAHDPKISHILDMACELTGDRRSAQIWFREKPIPGWAGKTASDLFAENKADKIIDYLQSVRLGSYS